MILTLESMHDLMCQMVRYGVVTGRDEAAMRVRVNIEDTTGGVLQTAWLQVLVARGHGDLCYDLPDIGDEVVCLFTPQGRECGFVLGSLYGEHKPPVSSGDKWHRVFKDGTVIEYDRANHQLLADVKGRAHIITTKDITAEAGTNINAKAANHINAEAGDTATLRAGSYITLTAPTIYQNGNVVAGDQSGSGTATVSEKAHRTINGSLVINGPLSVNGDVAVSGSQTVGGNSHAASRSGGGACRC